MNLDSSLYRSFLLRPSSFVLPRNYWEVFLSLPPKRTFCLTLLTLAWCCCCTMRRAVVAWSSGSTGGSGGCHRAGTRQTVVVVCLTCSGGTTVVVGPWWRRGTHVVVPAVAWYIAPSRSWTTHHGRTDIHGLVVVPMGIVAHTADISSATEGIIARRAIGYIETGTVGIHRVDTELNTISCPVQRTIEIVRVLIYLILIHGEHIAQIGVTTCPGSTEQIVVYSNRKHVVEIDLIHCFHLLRTKAKLVGHLIGEE